jgi:beta-phosphoglucomutase
MDLNFETYKAFIFDFDGTLVDTEPAHYEGFVRALSEVGISYVSYEDHLKVYTGTGARFILTKELEKNNKDLSLMDGLLASKKAHYLNYIEHKQINPIKGAIEFLNELKKQKIKIGLVSGGGKQSISKVMESAGIPNVFDEMVTTDDNYKPKPDPDGFLIAAQKLAVAPNECIAFEDAINGIKAIIAAGAIPIALSTYISKDKFHESCGEVVVIQDFTDLVIQLPPNVT